MSTFQSSTIIRAVLSFVQVMGIVAAGAAAQQRSHQKSIEIGEIARKGVLAAIELPDKSGLKSAAADCTVHFALHTGALAGQRCRGWSGG